MNNKTFGSGYFGEWVKGEYEIPAYNYVCNQYIDDKAVTQTNKAWMDRRNHLFLLGNDRVVVTCSNFGYAQVRQDEGTPKFLTDYDTKRHQYGGGFGYLISGNEVLSTYYNGNNMLREYGACYMKKEVCSENTNVQSLLFAPYGDDPVVINRITITNNSSENKEYKWHEYWAGEMYQFTFTQFATAQFSFNTANVSRLRRCFARSFNKDYSKHKDSGIIKKWSYSKRGIFVRVLNKLSQGFFRRTSKRFYNMNKAYAMDYNPPSVCLVSLGDGHVDNITNATAFFGRGGVVKPDMLSGISNLSKERNSMMMLINSFSLKAGESKTLNYAVIYEPEGFNLNDLIDKYCSLDINEVFKSTCEYWSKERVKVDIQGMEWIDRELLWHNAYLRGAMTYSSFYKTHILSQGGHYQYLMGLQGAPRDQLQHSLSFIFTEPYIAREHILFTLKELSPEGELPYATTGDGLMIALVMVPSDLQFMLLSYIGEYVLTTRDKDFLEQEYTTIDGQVRKVKEGVMLAYKYATEKVGRGPHGLIRMKTGDWNDQAVYGRVPISQTKTVHRIGESMLNSAMAVYSFNIFGKMLEYVGDKDIARESLRWSDEIKHAVGEQWNGKWLKRAWMGDKVGWLGDDLLWLEPQPWALITDTLVKDKAQVLVNNINEMCMKPNPNGAQLISFNTEKEEKSAGLESGVLENGGIWPAINGYLVWGLAKVDGKLAWEEWLRNSRAHQAEAYPDIWYGIWSGPDSVNSTYARYPGRTQNSKNPVTGKREKLFKLTVGVDWEDYPVFNLHAHTWQQYTIFKLLGLEFNAEGLSLKPVIPIDNYSVKSRIFSLSYDNAKYSCEYYPLYSDEMLVKFDLQNREASKLIVNKEEREIVLREGKLEFKINGSQISFDVYLK